MDLSNITIKIESVISNRAAAYPGVTEVDVALLKKIADGVFYQEYRFRLTLDLMFVGQDDPEFNAAIHAKLADLDL